MNQQIPHHSPHRTPLYSEHLRAHARIVDFSGWQMPLHYGSQIAEHHSVRKHAGLFDVSHMRCVDIKGSQTRQFLQKILANDVAKLKVPGMALYSCLLRIDGGVLDDVIVYMFADFYRIVLNCARADADLAWMQAHVHDFDVRIINRTDLALLAVQGPAARKIFAQIFPETQSMVATLAPFQAAPWGAAFVARTGYTGEDGLEIMLPAEDSAALWSALLQAGCTPCGLGARDTLRLEAGMCLYGQDLDEEHTPIESALSWSIDLTDVQRIFIGRSSLETARPKSATPNQTLYGLILEEGGILRCQQNVTTPAGNGTITSGGFSPTMNCSIALARLPNTLKINDVAKVEVREKFLSARIVAPKFVRNGIVLV